MSDAQWIDELTDEQCWEIFWLYVDGAETFLNRYPRPLLGTAMRYLLKSVYASLDDAPAK